MTLAVDTRPRFRLPFPRPPLLDSYVLGLLLRPSAICMGVTLIAMLLERVLRLINEMAASGAHLGFLYGMVFNLIPYYLGLALPASFFISLFMVISRLDDGNEIDPMLASGRSMSRIAVPLIATGVVFAIISLLLYGFLEPYGRYGYRAVRNQALNAGWTAQIQSQVFLSAGQELTISADRVDATGRKLHGVFIRRTTPKGETVITARTGRLSLSPDRKFTQVQLDHGLQYSDLNTGGGRVLGFDNISILEPSSMASTIRPRGGDERELTILELVRELRDPTSVIAHSALSAELYSRLARALSLPLLPLLALPLGLATKRGRRAPGLILAGVILVSFHHGLQLAKDLAARGHPDPLLTIGGVFGAFALGVIWLYSSSLKRPGDTPLARLLNLFQKLFDKAPTKAAERKTTKRSASHALPKYLARELGGRVLAAGISIVALLQLVDLLDRMPEILEHGVGVLGIFHYAMLRLPSLIEQAAGIAVLLGGIFTFMQLAKNSEIVAMRATGLSILQIFKMSLPVVLVVALVNIVVLDQLAPRATDALTSWWLATTPAAKKPNAQPKWFRINNDTVRANNATPDGLRLNGVRLYQRTPDKQLTQRIEAAYATRTPGGWTLHDAAVTRLGGDRAVTVRQAQAFWKTPLKPEDAARLFNGGFLITSATALRSLGGAIALNQSPSFYATRVHRTFAEPLGPLIMLLLALPIALGSTRSGTSVKWILYGMGGGLLYLVCDGLLTAMGQAGFLPPVLAAWMAPVIFGCGSVMTLLYSER